MIDVFCLSKNKRKLSVDEVCSYTSASDKISAGSGTPTMILKGCTFTGCSIAFINKSVAVEVLEGLTVDDIFDDC